MAAITFARGFLTRVLQEHLLMAPEVEVSGPAVYAMGPMADATECRMDYAVLVAGAPQGVSSVCAALRPARGKPKEEAETQLELLWQSEDCTLLEPKSLKAVRGRYGNQRANLRSRAVFGLARPWCHLIRVELFGSWGGILCESSPPADLLRVPRLTVVTLK
eukprot:Skav220844  [mRNA]  locus=scaffold1888:365677:370708:- [translate_table: standard]